MRIKLLVRVAGLMVGLAWLVTILLVLLDAFVRSLIRFDAKNTANSVVAALGIIRDTGTCNENDCIGRYHRAFLREKVWIKLCYYVSGPTFRRYAECSQRIIDRGGSVLNPKEWPRDWNGA